MYADAHSARFGLRVRFAGVVTQAASRCSSGAGSGSFACKRPERA